MLVYIHDLVPVGNIFMKYPEIILEKERNKNNTAVGQCCLGYIYIKNYAYFSIPVFVLHSLKNIQ